jgi:hypothetical protein
MTMMMTMMMTALAARLAQATVAELGQVIDQVRRPWAAQCNDRLRALLHRVGREPGSGAHEELAAALVAEVAGASYGDLAHVARGLGLSLPAPTADDVARVIVARLGPVPGTAPRGPWEGAALEAGVAWAMREFAEAAVTALVRARPWAPARRNHGRRHGR